MKRKPKNPGGYIGECGESCGAWAKPKPKPKRCNATAGYRIAFRFHALEIPGGLYAPETDRLAKAIDCAIRRAFKDGKRAEFAGMFYEDDTADKLHAKYGVKP